MKCPSLYCKKIYKKAITVLTVQYFILNILTIDGWPKIY